MLRRINQSVCMPYEAPRPAEGEDRWQRNEREDIKAAIDCLYEFREKLAKLHPMAMEIIEEMMQRPKFQQEKSK